MTPSAGNVATPADRVDATGAWGLVTDDALDTAAIQRDASLKAFSPFATGQGHHEARRRTGTGCRRRGCRS